MLKIHSFINNHSLQGVNEIYASDFFLNAIIRRQQRSVSSLRKEHIVSVLRLQERYINDSKVKHLKGLQK